MKNLFILWILILGLFCQRVPFVYAQAPKTAKIAFSANREGNRDIYLMNPDGSQQVNITNHRADDVSSVWSPTGEHILFASDRGHKAWGTWDLYLMEPDGSNVRKVFDKSALRSSPVWAPDGKRIAYSYGEIGNNLIYIGTIDGKEEERVAIGGTPAWSPDGTEIAFVVKAGAKRWEINMLNVQTRKQKVFFPPKAAPSWVRGPAWSPTGDKLAFAWLHRVPLADFLETETIYTVNRDGTRLTQIVAEAKSRATDPIWSPRGDELLYARWKHETKQIFKIALNEGQSEQLTHIGFWNDPTDWFDPAYALPVSPQPSLLTTMWGKLKTQD
ncbi:MAG: hypothetical protein OXI61_19180 [Candidatus Poribacteria bacterium]|nr:hypothetical protein [Candidatus Poribacteria bacterium]